MLIVQPYNKKIPIYNGDSLRDIENRISIELKTLPEFLKIESPPPLRDMIEGDVVVEIYDILSSAKMDGQGMSYNAWRLKLGVLFPDITEVEKIKLWVSQNKNLTNDIFILLVQNEIDTKSIEFDVSRFISRDLDEYKKNLSRRITSLKEKEGKVKNIRQELSEIKSSVKSTAFEITQLDYDLKTDLNLSPIEMFDKLRVGINIPFVSYSNFFKVIENFIPPAEWGVELDSFAILKLLTKTEVGIRERPVVSEFYSDVLVYNEPSEYPKVGNTIIKMKLSNKNSAEERKGFISTILKSIDYSSEIKLLESRQSGLAGKYYIPDFVVDSYVFSDLALNDDLFSYYININETVKATKKKNSIFFKFFDPNNPEWGTASVSIVNKVADKKDLEIRPISRLEIPYDSDFVRVKIRYALGRAGVDNFIKTFSTLLTYYNNKYGEIVEFYKKYIPYFKAQSYQQREVKISKKLKDIAPDVFLPGFSRAVCLHKPEIIDKGEAAARDHIVFPKSPEEGSQYIYACPPENKEYKYIGVKLNKMENKGQYPVIPCCFQQNQRDKKNSWYNKYIANNIVIEKKEKKIPKTGLSVLNLKDYGGVPPSMERLFYQIDPEFKYQRYGMSRTKSSFLECVLHSLDIDNFRSLEDSKRVGYIKSLRESKKMVESSYLARQELYDKTGADIENIIQSDDYFDPRFFISLLSQLYQCNIYVFTRKYRERDANTLIPRNMYGFYRIYRKDWPSILIFENYGNEADNLDYPQCELLGRWDQRQSVPGFVQTDQILKRDIEVIYRKSFVEFDPQTNVVIPTGFIGWFSSQYIDNFGKSRFLKIKKEGIDKWVMTSPLSILADLPVATAPPIRQEFSLVEATDFIKKMGLVVTGIHVESNLLTEIKTNFILEAVNIDVYLPIRRGAIPTEFGLIDRYLYEQFQSFVKLENERMGVLDSFRYNKKIAKCITGNLYHLYSKFLSSNSLIDKPQAISSIEKFIDLYIRLDPTHVYPPLPPLDIRSGNGIMVDDKIILNTEELAKRLIYSLRLQIERAFDMIAKYRFIEKVIGYYQDVEDFTKRPNQIIVKGSEIVKNWYLINIDNFRIYRKIQPDLFTYFLRDKNVTGTDRIYIANTREKLEDGFLEFYGWGEGRPLPEFDLIVNQNNKWKRYRVGGGAPPRKIEVVGYTVEGVNKFVFIIPY